MNVFILKVVLLEIILIISNYYTKYQPFLIV